MNLITIILVWASLNTSDVFFQALNERSGYAIITNYEAILQDNDVTIISHKEKVSTDEAQKRPLLERKNRSDKKMPDT